MMATGSGSSLATVLLANLAESIPDHAAKAAGPRPGAHCPFSHTSKKMLPTAQCGPHPSLLPAAFELPGHPSGLFPRLGSLCKT